MTHSDHAPHNIPSPEALVDFLRTNSEKTGRPETLRRDIAKFFHIKGETARRRLKQLLSEMVHQETLLKKGKSYWVSGDAPAEKNSIEKKIVSKIDTPGVTLEKPADNSVILGILQREKRRTLLAPLDRKDRTLYVVDEKSIKNLKAELGDYVKAYISKGRAKSSDGKRLKDAKGLVILKEVLSTREGLVRQLSMLAIKRYEIPDSFPESVIDQSEKAILPTELERRTDLRDIPLVTIDDMDARDHDDAVYAEPDTDERNKGGWRLLVAIADVSYFVTPGSALDKEAITRGNSTYFPDRVVPMLPERLSNDLCSLRPHEDRPCLAVWMRISKSGKLLSQDFFRGLMRSHGKLTYIGVQNYHDKKEGHGFPEGFDTNYIDALFGAYGVLKKAREKRGTLEIELPEQRIFLTDKGGIDKIEPRPRLETHQLIEEFMVLANVSAAKFITDKKKPCLFRVHESPAEERTDELGQYLKIQNLPASLPKGNIITPLNFTQILRNVVAHPLYPVINQMVLRCQSRAEYQPENLGHFGLNLTHYAHFTSPIRRYADLLVHRAICSIIDKKPEEYPYTHETLSDIGKQISECERRSTKAERETIDRYVAMHLEDRFGETFKAVVSGMTEFAIFLTLSETKSDGILPLRNLNGDYFTYDSKTQSFYGRRSHVRLNLGDEIDVTLEFSNPISGSVVFSSDLGKGDRDGSKHPYKRPVFKRNADNPPKKAERRFERAQGQFKGEENKAPNIKKKASEFGVKTRVFQRPKI